MDVATRHVTKSSGMIKVQVPKEHHEVHAPRRSDAAGFSFVGVTFSSPIVARVRIKSGQAAITGLNKDISAYGKADLVAMDDFISGEPHAIR